MPMTYRDALEWLVATGSRGMREGLGRTEALLEALGNPERGLRGVLVAGTNGKGSVCAMVESACRAAGLGTVLLVKPHLTSYRERVVVDGQPLDGQSFADLIERVQPAADAVERSGVGAPTQFEILTALGILAAADRRPDVVVCEVGLGGRLDSTNVLDLGVSAITSVALDHRDRLGDTVEEIAAEKAGILKRGNDVVTGATGAALDIVRAHARRVGTEKPLILGDAIECSGETRGAAGAHVVARCGDLIVDAVLPLSGAFQIDNAGVAVGICAALARRGFSALTSDSVRRGLESVAWRGRLEWIDSTPPLLVDGAHNPAAIAAIVPAVREIAGQRPLVALVGVMQDKDGPALLDALRPLGAMPVFTQAGTPRATSALDLARWWGAGARAIPDLPDALVAARLLAGDEGLVLVCGSLYLAGDVIGLLDAQRGTGG